MGGVKDHKANTSLTILTLWSNSVRDASAVALADAVQENGFDVQEVCVQGVCLLSQQMSLRKVV